jgi:hypothetical protein
MYSKFDEYKESVKKQEQEWQRIQYVGKDGQRVSDGVKVPLTLEGFKRFCWDTNVGSVEQYFFNKDGLYDDFVGICARIRNEIRENQIVGGMNGFFNPSITQRLNGLADKNETKIIEEPRIFNID